MLGIGVLNSEAKRIYVPNGMVGVSSSGTSLASGSTYGSAGVFAQPGDYIIFAYTNSGTPTLTSPTTGVTWTQYKTTGGSAPQPTILVGLVTVALSSFVVNGTAAGGGGYVWAYLRGMSGLLTQAQAVWSATTGGTSGAINYSTKGQGILVAASAQFGAVTVSSETTSVSTTPMIKIGSNAVSRSIDLRVGFEPTKPSAETVSVTWSAAQTGGLLVLPFYT